MWRAIVFALLVACSGTPPTVDNRAAPPVTASPGPVRELTVVEGTPTKLDDGTILRVSKVLYAHAKDDKNISMATFTFEANGKTEELVLERTDAPASGDVGAWRITLESADPYQQPSRAHITIQRLR
jgi:hypothetical protein